VRLEQLYPFPAGQLIDIVEGYAGATTLCWLQEEPENMGAWGFLHGRLHRTFRDDVKLTHVSRWESGSPAAGSKEVSDLERTDLLDRSLTVGEG